MQTDTKQLFAVENEVLFWGNQIKEHMNFIYLGLADDNQRLINLKQKAVYLKSSWENVLSMYEKKQYTKVNLTILIDETYNYQIIIQDYIKNNVWIGWLSYSFMEHLINELLYFQKKIEGSGYNLKEEMVFWLWHHESEMAASEKLLDPLEKELSEITKDYIEEIKILQEDLVKLSGNSSRNKLNDKTIEILNEYLLQTNELKDGIVNRNILTNISRDMINHVIREGERAIDIFNLL
jgi:hypothetical protein